MAYHDSVGNRYHSVPPAKDPPGAGKSRNGNKKVGRNKRKPSAKRYLSERRWEKNKARRADARRRPKMPSDSASGSENLRADFKVFDATTTGAYEKDESAGKGGTDALGDATNATVLSNPGKSAPGGSKGDVPKGVQTFDDEV